MSRETIGERIRRERTDRGLTLRDAADAVGWSFSYLSRIETDQWDGSDELLIALAELFGADPDEFLMVAGHIPRHLARRLLTDPLGGLAHLRAYPVSPNTDGTRCPHCGRPPGTDGQLCPVCRPSPRHRASLGIDDDPSPVMGEES